MGVILKENMFRKKPLCQISYKICIIIVTLQIKRCNMQGLHEFGN